MKLRTTRTVFTNQECGNARCQCSARIYEHLSRVGMNGQTIADSLGTSRQWVSRVITGKEHSPRVLDALRAAGVPEKYICDPRCMGAPGKEAA